MVTSRFLSVLAVAAVVLGGCSAPVRDDTRAPEPPPMGWNSWNSGIELSEQSVRQIIDAMVSSGLRDAGYRYVNLDAGWAAPTRDGDGKLHADPTRFPHGLVPLVQYAHDRGLRFGLYASPYDQICGQDPRIASRGHETLDAATFAEWGVDYLKYDWCRTDADHDDQVRAFTAMRDALHATGRTIFYSINPNCAGDTTAGTRYDWSGIADMVRANGDLVPIWHYVLPLAGPTDPFVTGLDNGVPKQFTAALTGDVRPSYRRDPDMLVVGLSWGDFVTTHTPNADLEQQAQAIAWVTAHQPGLTEDEQRSHFSLWAMMSAPLLAGNDLRTMTPDITAILTNREVITVDQDPSSNRPHTAADQRIWVKPLSDGSVAVALFNTGDAPTDLSTTAVAAGLPQARCYAVRDLWAHQNAKTSAVISAPALAPHAVQLFRVRAGC